MRPTLPIQIPQTKIAEFCQHHRIRKLSLFGFVLRDDFSPNSDVDVYIQHFWVIGYFDNGTTSGVVEGINNRLKLIKRLGYGFRNFENFSLRCLICWHLNIGSA
jgi:predicted nucleotidyltransferase